MAFGEIFKIFRERFRLFLAFFVLFIIVGLGIYLGIDYFKNNTDKDFGEYITQKKDAIIGKTSLNVFEVKSANFDFGYKKIPYDTSQIEFYFSKDLDKKAINKDSFQIYPEISGNIEVKGNQLIYKLEEKLEKGKHYEIYLMDNIKSKNNKSLNSIKNYSLEAVGGVEVVKFLPQGELQNLDQNISLIFNMPVVPMTNLDQRDKLPCPVKIKPEIEGKCKWTTTSVLEFIPSDSFKGATKYEIKLTQTDDLLYPLKKESSYSFQTPDLDFYIPENFSASKGLNIRTNFPVGKKELENYIEVLSNTGNSLDYNLSGINDSETKYNIKLNGNSFVYDKDYLLKIKSGVKSKYGNKPFKKNLEKKIHSYSFLRNIDIYQEKYSQAGALEDTQKINLDKKKYYGAKNYSYLPQENLVFHLNFEEEIPEKILDRKQDFFKIYSGEGDLIDFDVNYGKKEVLKEEAKKKKENYAGKMNFSDEDKKIVDNNKELILKIKGKLKNSQKYFLEISENITDNLNKTIVKEYSSSPDLEINRFKFVSYSKSCIYFSNEVDFQQNSGTVSLSPDAKIKSIDVRTVLPRQIRRKDFSSLEEKNQYLLKNGYCPVANKGETVLSINTRLNPYSEYILSLSGDFQDIYGNKLGKSSERKVKTQGLKAKDKYIYNSVSKDRSVFPSYKQLVINLQSINMQKTQLEVCEMDINGYLDYIEENLRYYSNSKDYVPECLEKAQKEIDLKNHNWNLSNNKFDLEKDILGKKFENKFVLVSGNVSEFKEENRYNQNRGKSFSDLYIRSNLLITLEDGQNKSLLFTTNYTGDKIVKNLEFDFYREDHKNGGRDGFTKVEIKPKFNEEKGVYEIENTDFDVIVAKNQKYFGVLTKDLDRLSNYSFDYIGGEAAQKKNYLYLYTDRPIYKPGDKVRFKGILRKFTFEGYKKSDVGTGILKVYDKENTLVNELKISVDKNSNFTGDFVLPEDVTLGRYDFKFFPSDKKNSIKNNAEFFIEEYKKPTFKINVDGEKSDYSLGDTANFEVKPTYYFGGKMINAEGEYKLLVQNYFFDAKDYSNYQFGEGYSYFRCIYWGNCDYDDDFKSANKFKIDNKGKHILDYEFPDEQKKGEKMYKFIFEVTDPDTQKSVSKTVSRVLHNTDAYVGIKSSYYNTKKNGIDLDGVVLDWDANPLQNKKVKLELIKKDWKSVKKQGVDGVFYNHYTLEEKKEQEKVLKSNKKGKFSNVFTPQESGEYKINAIYTGENGKSFNSSTSLYVAGDDFVVWRQGNNDVTDLVNEEVMLNVGETQELVLKSPVDNGKALFVVEKDEGILDYFVHDIQSFGDKINIKVKKNYYPNFYVKAFLIGKQEDNPLPVYKRALSLTKVNTKYKKLNVDIRSNKKHYLPGAKVKLDIKVTDKNGKGLSDVNGSIAVVDESVLALKGNPKKNLFAYFYDMKRYLGILTFTSLKNIVEKLEIKDPTDGRKGGDGENIKGGDSDKKRGEFRDTAYWLGNFSTDKNGKASIVTDKLPDNLTTRKVEALVNTSDDNKVGIGRTDFKTSKRLMVNPNLPTFLSAGDKISFNPVVFNKSGKNREFKVSLSGTNIEIQDSEKLIYIEDGKQKTLDFDAIVKDMGIMQNKDLPVSKINIKAVSGNGKIIDEVEKYLQISASSTPEAVSTVGKTDQKSFEERINVGNIKENAGFLKINYSATLMAFLLEGIDYLNNYPYGCIEQKFSSVMPNIFIKNLYDSVGNNFDLKKKYIKVWQGEKEGYFKKSIDEAIKGVLAVTKNYQNKDGGFVYWSKQTDTDVSSDVSLTSYIVESIGYIKELGYYVEKDALKNAIDYLKKEFYDNQIDGCKKTEYRNCKYSDITRLEIINAILTYNSKDYEAYKMRKILDKDKNDLKFQLTNLKVIGKILNTDLLSQEEKNILRKKSKESVDKILNEEVVFNPRGAYIGNNSYSNRLKNTVDFIEAISLLGVDDFSNIEQIIDNSIRWIMQQKKPDGSFGSTQKTINVIKGLTAYLQKTGELKNLDMEVNLNLNSKNILSQKFNSNNKFEVYSKSLKLQNLENENVFSIDKFGSGNVYYDLNLNYYLSSKNIKSRDEGFFVKLNYYDYEEYSEIKLQKQKEWTKYNNGKLAYSKLKYPKDVFEYLKPLTGGKVGDILLCRYKIITNEARDKIAIESFIPAGAQILNPNLDTQKGYYQGNSNELFDISEFRKERFFGYKDLMSPGEYSDYYLIRLTHEGEFNIKPTRVFKFYNEEVFGRTEGKLMEIER